MRFLTDDPFATKVTEPDWVRLEERWTQRALAGVSRLEVLKKKGDSLSPAERIEALVEAAYASHIPTDDKSALYNIVVKRDGDWEFRKIVINAGDISSESLLVLAWMYRDSQLVGFRTESVPPNWQVSQIENRVAVSAVEGEKPWTLLFDKDNPFEFEITE